tara:strand:- start:16275 stop:16535 length:261 start_codon:yes stop_codon:yes gene_type:complete
LAIVLALAAGALFAQVPGQPEQTAQDTERTSPTETQGSREAPGQATGGGNADGASETQAGSAASPFIYEPSEDISEDLSVSFPVDI